MAGIQLPRQRPHAAIAPLCWRSASRTEARTISSACRQPGSVAIAKRWRAGLLLSLAASLACAWQGPDPTPATARFRSLTDVDGLSQMTALALAQDRDGLLWVGTQVGLNRYDGARFRTFDRRRHPSGSSTQHDVSTLLTATDGTLWVGTLNGLYRFDPDTEEVRPLELGDHSGGALGHQRINALTFDGTGVLWIASDAGLSRLDAPRGPLATFVPPGSEPRVLALAHAGAESLWIGKTDGLWRFTARDSPQFQRAVASGPAAQALAGWIQALRPGADGHLWVGTKDRGLLRLDPGSGTLTQWRHDPARADSLSHDRVYALLEDSSRRLWVGTEAGADLLLPGADGGADRFTRFQHRAARPGSIGSGRVVSLLEDAAGDLWFGTWSGGASLLTPVRSRFHSFSVDALDPDATDAAEVVHLVPAGGERLWLGTRRGLYQFDADSDQLHALPATTGMRVYAVADDAGTLLLGTDQGVHRFDPADGRVQRLTLPVAVGQPYVDFIIVADDRVFVSTRDADLFVLDRALRELLAHHRMDTRAHFMAPFDGGLRIVGGDRGLYWLSADGTTVVHRLRATPERLDALQSDTCHFYLRARDGRRWLATAAGLHEMLLPDGQPPEQARFRVLRQGQSANANAIKGVQEDARGRLWMGTNAGISRLDPATGTFTQYAGADGAIDRGYYAFVFTRTASGQFALGGASGFTVFDPIRIGELPPPPPPLLTELEIDHRRVLFDAEDPAALLREPLHRSTLLTLPPGRGRTLRLGFASPYYVAPEHLRFAYRLEGFNDDWIEDDGRERIANYTNLAPGDYRFRMRARTSDASFTGAERVLKLRVQPHWWQTRWAQAAALLGLIALVSAAFFGRLRLLARQRRLLSEEVARATAQSSDALAQMHSAHRALAEAYARIDQLSRTDPLTGVGNRRLLDQALPALLERAQAPAEPPEAHRRLAFLLLDVDHFKELNDHHGHSAGDAVLSALGALLRSRLVDPALAVRWGGEEFLVVMPVADDSAAVAEAERLRRAIQALEPQLPDGRRVVVTASLGCACYPFDLAQPQRLNWEQMVELADAALYAAKHAGRDCVRGLRCTGTLPPDFESHLRDAVETLSRETGLVLMTGADEPSH